MVNITKFKIWVQRPFSKTMASRIKLLFLEKLIFFLFLKWFAEKTLYQNLKKIQDLATNLGSNSELSVEFTGSFLSFEIKVFFCKPFQNQRKLCFSKKSNLILEAWGINMSHINYICFNDNDHLLKNPNGKK